MVRGTTPTITFDFNFDWEKVKRLTATFEYGNKDVFKIEKERFTYFDKKISATLTQEETLSLPNNTVEIQLKVQSTDGIVFASNIVKIFIGEILDEVVM